MSVVKKSNTKIQEKKTEENILQNIKNALLPSFDESHSNKESNIYTYHHISDGRFLSIEEKNDKKFFTGYRSKLRNMLDKHINNFLTIEKNAAIKKISNTDVKKVLEEEGIVDNFMKFYKKFYKINDFTASSVANAQRQEKIRSSMICAKKMFDLMQIK